MKIISYSISFIGQRLKNQDSITETIIDKEREIYFFAIADGMGGLDSGETASQTAIEQSTGYLKEYFSSHLTSFDLKCALTNAIKTADKEIMNIVEKKTEIKSMGTTLTCILIAGNEYIVGNIGDSRTYYFNSQSMFQITQDHSAIEDYRRKRGYYPEDATMKYIDHLVTRCLGFGIYKPDIFPVDKASYTLKENSGYLLCSDGLIIDKRETYLTQLYNYVIRINDLKACAESLIRYAIQRGSNDNISVILVEIGNFKKRNIPLSKYTDLLKGTLKQ